MSSSSPGSSPARVGRRTGRDRHHTGGRHAARVLRDARARIPSDRDGLSSRCCSPSPGGSAPASRWRSRRWRGWSGSFEPPVYCYHEIVHNRLVVDRFRELRAWSSSTTSTTCPPAHPLMLSAHGSAPEVVHGRPRPGPLRRERGVPARHQGPPRGQGAGREGLHDPLRRPRRPRRGHRHAGRRARRHAPGRARGRPRPTCSRPSTTRRRSALLAQTTLALDDWKGVADRARARFPELWTATRNDLCFATTNRQAALHGHRQPGRRRRGDRQRQLVEHARAGQGGAERRAARRCCGSTVPTSSTPTALGDARIVGVTAGRQRAGGPRAGGDRAPRARRGRRAGRTSPTRTSTSRHRASCAS